MVRLTKRPLKAIEWALFLTLFFGSVSHGQVHLTNNQIQNFDFKEVDTDTELCKKLAPTNGIEFQTWILDELKKQGYAEAKSENIKTEEWLGDITELKLNGDDLQGTWVRGSTGTSGIINGKAIDTRKEDAEKENAEDKNETTGAVARKKVLGSIIDLGKASVADLKKIQPDDPKALASAWLVERTEVLPLYALSLEAKARRASALLVYTDKDHALTGDDVLQNVIYPLPIISLNYKTAQMVVKKIKFGQAQLTLGLRTEFPVLKSQAAILVKARAHDYGLIISATRDNCREVAVMLGLLKWLKDNKLSVKTTNFVFVDAKAKFATQAAFGLHYFDFALLEKGEFEPKKFLSRWFSADEFPTNLVSVHDITKRAEKLSGELKGLVDGDELKKYNDTIKHLQNLSGSSKAAVAFRLDAAYSDESMFKTADEIKTLREIYTSVQRGLWQKAQNQSTKIGGFNWANQVSVETFMEFQKTALAQGRGVDPHIWVLLQKGKPAADELLKAVELEIDRLSQKLTESFAGLEKNVEEIQKSGG